MAIVTYSELIRSNASQAWNVFSYKTGHNLETVLKPGYFSLCRLRFSVDDFIDVLVKNEDEYIMAKLIVIDPKDEKIRVKLISALDLRTKEVDVPKVKDDPNHQRTALRGPGVR